MVATISRDELREKIERGDDFVLVETLPEDAYRQRHRPGALNLRALEDAAIAAEAAVLLPDTGADIVVYRGSRF